MTTVSYSYRVAASYGCRTLVSERPLYYNCIRQRPFCKLSQSGQFTHDIWAWIQAEYHGGMNFFGTVVRRSVVFGSQATYGQDRAQVSQNAMALYSCDRLHSQMTHTVQTCRSITTLWSTALIILAKGAPSDGPLSDPTQPAQNGPFKVLCCRPPPLLRSVWPTSCLRRHQLRCRSSNCSDKLRKDSLSSTACARLRPLDFSCNQRELVVTTMLIWLWVAMGDFPAPPRSSAAYSVLWLHTCMWAVLDVF